ncbi:MAG TPA: fibronectin type III domain-containing protein [Candidatus Limnocylindrales bacterium]
MRTRILAVAAIAICVLAPAAPALAADTTPPTAPTNLRVTAQTDTSVTLSWNKSTDNSGTFYYLLTDNHYYLSYPHQTVTSLTLTSLMPNTTYVFTLVAFDAARNYSAPATVTHTTPPDTTAPTAPVLSSVYVLAARAQVAWTKAVDSSPFVFYTLFANGVARTGDMGGGLGQVMLNLTPNTSYTLQVSARDLYGNTSFSNTITITTPVQTDFTPPTAPSGLRGRADLGSCEVYVSWTASTDNVEAQSRILYRYRIDGQLSPVRSWMIGRTSNVGANVLEAPAEGTHVFTVEAVDGSGNVSAVSNELTLTNPDC